MNKNETFSKNQQDNLEGNFIDKFYEEEYDRVLLEKHSEEFIGFEKKIYTTMENLEINVDDLELPVNISAQLSKGYKLVEKKMGIIDTLKFLSLAMVMFSIVFLTIALYPAIAKVYLVIGLISPIAMFGVYSTVIKGSDEYE